jgi:hypothetical protein
MNRLTNLLLILFLGTNVFASSDHAHSILEPSALLESAGYTLALAQSTELRAVDVLKNANNLRNTVNELRAKEYKAEDDTEKEMLHAQVNLLAEQLQLWQNEGALLRQLANEMKHSASELLPIGFQALWPDQLKFIGAMQLAGNDHAPMAHNTTIRSVHPTMLGKMTDGTVTETADDMTLAMPSMTGQSAPEQLNVSTFQVSRELHYFAHIEPANSDTHTIPLNTIHQWHLFLTDQNGLPVSNAQIEFSGHMPGHVHGLPTLPRVTQELSPGLYLVDGVKFQMKGWWVIEFITKQGDINDSILFNLNL